MSAAQLRAGRTGQAGPGRGPAPWLAFVLGALIIVILLVSSLMAVTLDGSPDGPGSVTTEAPVPDQGA